MCDFLPPSKKRCVKKVVMRQYAIKQLDRPISEWRPQPWDREIIYIANDLRGVYQIASHTASGLKAGIYAATRQSVSTSSIFEACHSQLKGHRTGGTFTVKCMSRSQAVEYLNQSAYPQRLVALIDPTSVRVQ